MDAIQSNKTISETSEEGSRWGGSGLYSLLVPYKNLLIALKRVFRKSEGWEKSFELFNSRYSFPEKIGENIDDAENMLLDELNKNSMAKSVKVIAVRHPLARLQSCWRDKMTYWYTDDGKKVKHDQILHQMWHRIWEFISENLETEASNSTKGVGNIVSFEGFLKFITLSNKKGAINEIRIKNQ